MEERTLEGALEARAQQSAFKGLALEGALEARAQQSTFEVFQVPEQREDGGVTQCQPEDIHGEFKPSNRNELLPKSPPFHAKGRRSTDPITNARCKGTDGSGNGSGRLHVYIPRGDFNPSLSPSTKQYSGPFRTDKGKPFS